MSQAKIEAKAEAKSERGLGRLLEAGFEFLHSNPRLIARLGS
jgi:hypothetical protein